MEHLGTLYCYELKKILRRKLIWIMFAVCITGILMEMLLPLAGTYYVDGEAVDTYYHMGLVAAEYQRTLTGRKIDQQLLEEMAEGYAKIPDVAGHYDMTEEYQKYARPYEAILDFVRNWTGMNVEEAIKWKPDEGELYAKREEWMRAEWERFFLADGEKEFWQKKNAQLVLPLTYEYCGGYADLLYTFTAGGILMLLFVCVSLSGVFAEEHARRTDQLLLTAAKGKNVVYWAKILAGISVAATYSLITSALMFLLGLGIDGAGGFFAEVQFCIPQYPYPLTMGDACLIAYGILLLTSVLMGVMIMVFSERLQSSIAALAIAFGFIIAGAVINIPGEYRVIAQIWDWLPTAFCSLSNVFDVRTLGVGGHYMVSWQAVPMVYAVCAVAFVLIGWRVYGNYQVEV